MLLPVVKERRMKLFLIINYVCLNSSENKVTTKPVSKQPSTSVHSGVFGPRCVILRNCGSMETGFGRFLTLCSQGNRNLIG